MAGTWQDFRALVREMHQRFLSFEGTPAGITFTPEAWVTIRAHMRSDRTVVQTLLRTPHRLDPEQSQPIMVHATWPPAKAA